VTATTTSATQQESQAEQVLRVGYRWLRFPQPLEAQFREYYLNHSRRLVSIGLLVALLPTIGFALIDKTLAHGAHVYFQLPILVLCIVMALSRFYFKWYQRVALVSAPIFGLGSVLAMVLMVQRGGSTDIMLVGARLLLIAFFLYFMLGLRMSQALCCNVIVLAGLVTAMVAGWLPYQTAFYILFALVCANVIGSVGAFALERANRVAFLDRARLEALASRDGLTQLLNRQTFEQRADSYWQQHHEDTANAAVIMIDVDYFKAFNDHYGHQAGDDCLRRIANAVRTAIGKHIHHSKRLVGRYGGEELIAMVFDCSHDQLNTLCNAILAEVTAEKIEHQASLSCEHVSVSIGAALHQSPLPSTHKNLANAADRALYAAKNQGRNRAVILNTFADATIARKSDPGQRPASRQRQAELRRNSDLLPRDRAS
jgi:diguanylate cyclase (GGDEF)-like protein